MCQEDLDLRAQQLNVGLQQAVLGDQRLREHEETLGAKNAELESLLQEVIEQEDVVRLCEEELPTLATSTQSLETELRTEEEAVAAEELALIESRNAAEAKLQLLKDESAALEEKLVVMSRDDGECCRCFDELERERRLLRGDEAILAQVHEQVDPLRRRLSDQAAGLAAEEAELHILEVQCDEEEPQVVHEHNRTSELLSALELRACELASREEEGEQKRSRLLQRQRDLGGAEIRLSGLECALQQRRAAGNVAATPARDGPGARGAAADAREGISPSDGERAVELAAVGSANGCSATQRRDLGDDVKREELARERLQRLRSAEADWGERMRAQQVEIQKLEARAQQLQAQVSRAMEAGHGPVIASHLVATLSNLILGAGGDGGVTKVIK